MAPRRTRFAAAALVAAVGAGAAVSDGGAQAAPAKKRLKTKIVRVHDNYFSPAKLTVKVGQRVQWVWPTDVGDTHDVKLKKAPKGVKKFHSMGYATNAKWPRPKGKLFTKPGTYEVYCTYHETEMTMTITVKK